MDKDTFEMGLAIRRELMGADVVDAAFDKSDDFDRPMQELVTKYAWGAVWSRPDLDRRSRSILNMGIFAALNRPDELASHVKVAVSNGVTREEVRECLLQAAVYCGMPVGMEMFRVARQVFDELRS